jgi:hypothetical protein
MRELDEAEAAVARAKAAVYAIRAEMASALDAARAEAEEKVSAVRAEMAVAVAAARAEASAEAEARAEAAEVKAAPALSRRWLVIAATPSPLVEPADEVLLLQWLAEEGVHVAAPQLLFRASQHGWEAPDFHRHCDGQGPTLVLVRSTTGHVFGGYASGQWKSLL